VRRKASEEDRRIGRHLEARVEPGEDVRNDVDEGARGIEEALRDEVLHDRRTAGGKVGEVHFLRQVKRNGHLFDKVVGLNQDNDDAKKEMYEELGGLAHENGGGRRLPTVKR
jgi:hypothetical protein